MYMASIHLQLKRKCLTQNCGKKVELINSKEGRVLSGVLRRVLSRLSRVALGKKNEKQTYVLASAQWPPVLRNRSHTLARAL